MRYSQLTGEQILKALSESYNAIAASTKYRTFLTRGVGLPKDDAAQIELVAGNLKVGEEIRTEIRALEHELDLQEGAEKSRF
jgi:predicted HAD superfamily phosphohydrolase